MRAIWAAVTLAVLAAACDSPPPPPPEAKVPTVGEPLVIEVDVNGRILWNGEEVSLEELERRARAASGTPTELRFMPDGKAGFERIKQVATVLEPTGLLKKAYVVGGTAE